MLGAAWVRACHPEPTVAVTAVAALLAAASGHRAGTAVLATACIAASQLAVGWSNDAVDARRDTAVGRHDKPVVSGRLSRRAVAVAAAVAATATVALALPFGPLPTAVATVGLGSALAYNWPGKRTAASPLAYAVSFAALPTFVVLTVPATPPWWLPAAGGLLGAGAHFANALPDLADDTATGVRGAPHRVGARASAAIAGGLLLAATVVLVTAPGRPTWYGWAGLAAAAGALGVGGWRARLAARRGGRPVALFRAFLVVAVVDVGLLLAGGAG